MKNSFRHITIYLLATMILVATTGISVCCMFGCHDAQVVSGEVDCCEKNTAELPSKHSQNSCPDCEATYISLDADYLLSSVNFKLSLPFAIVFQPVIFFTENYIPGKTTTPWEHNLPPPPFGKTLLPHIQSFLC